MKKLNLNPAFAEQVGRFAGPTGLVYFIEEHQRKYESVEDCFNKLLANARAINDHDPMQFHGVKTDQQLIDMATDKCNEVFERDRSYKLSMNTAAVKAGKGISLAQLLAQQESYENRPGFVRWWDFKKDKLTFPDMDADA